MVGILSPVSADVFFSYLHNFSFYFYLSNDAAVVIINVNVNVLAVVPESAVVKDAGRIWDPCGSRDEKGVFWDGGGPEEEGVPSSECGDTTNPLCNVF